MVHPDLKCDLVRAAVHLERCHNYLSQSLCLSRSIHAVLCNTHLVMCRRRRRRFTASPSPISAPSWPSPCSVEACIRACGTMCLTRLRSSPATVLMPLSTELCPSAGLQPAGAVAAGPDGGAPAAAAQHSRQGQRGEHRQPSHLSNVPDTRKAPIEPAAKRVKNEEGRRDGAANTCVFYSCVSLLQTTLPHHGRSLPSGSQAILHEFGVQPDRLRFYRLLRLTTQSSRVLSCRPTWSSSGYSQTACASTYTATPAASTFTGS